MEYILKRINSINILISFYLFILNIVPKNCNSKHMWFLLSYDIQNDRQSILVKLFCPKIVTQELRMTATAPRDSIENFRVYCFFLSLVICKRILSQIY